MVLVFAVFVRSSHECNYLILDAFSIIFVCFCIVKAECGQKTNQLTSYFQNPGWPAASEDRLICTLTIELQPDVTQVLLDFILFEVRLPRAEESKRN